MSAYLFHWMQGINALEQEKYIVARRKSWPKIVVSRPAAAQRSECGARPLSPRPSDHLKGVICSTVE
jgi:hypothetical protein